MLQSHIKKLLALSGSVALTGQKWYPTAVNIT